jgi:hypothetical protein
MIAPLSGAGLSPRRSPVHTVAFPERVVEEMPFAISGSKQIAVENSSPCACGGASGSTRLRFGGKSPIDRVRALIDRTPQGEDVDRMFDSGREGSAIPDYAMDLALSKIETICVNPPRV